MKKLFLYIDESKDLPNRKIELVIWISHFRLTHCNNEIQYLKDYHGINTELHGYRRKTAQIFWKKITHESFWEKTNLLEKIYIFSFENFQENWDNWNTVYSHILSWIRGSEAIYADKITLSTQDMKLLKYNTWIHGTSVTFLNSTNNPIIQLIDLICGYIHDEQYPSHIGKIPIEYKKITL